MTIVKCSVITNHCFDSTVLTAGVKGCYVAKESRALCNLVFGSNVVSMFSAVQKRFWSAK